MSTDATCKGRTYRLAVRDDMDVGGETETILRKSDSEAITPDDAIDTADTAVIAGAQNSCLATFRSSCTDYMKRCIPIFVWLPNYSLNNFQCDVIAGFTVALMVVPQALAYASIARLPPEYGMYSAFMGSFVYAILGTSKDVALGPVTILSLMVSSYSDPRFPALAVTLSFLTGVILLAMGIFRLGFLVRFVSIPVISGFTSAAAITIALTQFKDLTGLKNIPQGFFPNVIEVFKRVESWNWYDVLYGGLCIVSLIAFMHLGRINRKGEFSRTQRILRRCCWLIGFARNAIIVVLSMVIVNVLAKYNKDKVLTLVNPMPKGLPPFKAPEFTMFYQQGNVTETMSFPDVLRKLEGGLAFVPLVAFMESIAIAKAFARVNKYKIDPTQELIALGMANIMGSFVSAYPVTASFSRSAVNSQSGVRTPLAGVTTGVLVLLATYFLSGIFKYIPKACLAAVIIAAVYSLLEVHVVKQLWKIRKIDLIPLAVTFFGSFYTLEAGLITGILVSLLFLLYPALNPGVELKIKPVTVLYIQDGLFFPGIEHLTEKVGYAVSSPERPVAVVLDMCGVTHLDYTVVRELTQLVSEVKQVSPGTEMWVVHPTESVRTILELADLGFLITTPESVHEKYEESFTILTEQR